MGKVDFTPEHKSKDSQSYPKLYLDKGERARIVVIEAPSMRWVHTLRKNTIEDGRAVYETKRTARGEERQVPKMDFVGQHFCKGDDEVLAEKGIDPENCLTCRAAESHSAIDAPKRRFAMHVIKYRIQPGAFKVQDPFSVELVAWTFTDNRFDTLVDLQQEWGDLRKIDLGIGPCEVKQWQKYDIQVLPHCEWLQSEDRKKLVAEVFKNNQITGPGGLDQLIARDLSAELMQQDVDRVLEAHEEAFGRSEAKEPPDFVTAAMGERDGGVDLGIDSLFSGATDDVSKPAPAKESDGTPDPWANTPAGISGIDPLEEKAEEPAKQPAPKQREGEVDFDSLLDSIG